MVRVGSMDGLQVWRAYTASGQDRADPLRYMSSSYRRGFRRRLIRYYNRPPTVPGNRNPGCLWGAIAQHRDHLLAGPTSTTVTPSNSAARARSTPRTRPAPGPGATRAGRTLAEPLVRDVPRRPRHHPRPSLRTWPVTKAASGEPRKQRARPARPPACGQNTTPTGSAARWSRAIVGDGAVRKDRSREVSPTAGGPVGSGVTALTVILYPPISRVRLRENLMTAALVATETRNHEPRRSRRVPSRITPMRVTRQG